MKNHSTSYRAFNPYYTNAPERQPIRWHIWCDGAEVISLLCEGGSSKKWQVGPDISASDLSNGEQLIGYSMSILDGLYGKRYKGLGVIFHIADSEALEAVVSAYDDLDQFDDVKLLAANHPERVVLGAVADAPYRWRAFPIEGASNGKIVFPRLSISDMRGVKELSEVDAPISVAVRNAQVEAMTVTSRLVDGITADGIGENGSAYARLVILQYRRVTNLTLYDAKGVPLATRQLGHADGRLSRQMCEEYQLLLNRVPAGVTDLQVVIFHFAGASGDGVTAVEAELQKTTLSTKLNVVIQTMPGDLMLDLMDQFMKQSVDLDRKVVFPAECVLEYPEFLVKDDSGNRRRHTERMIEASQDSFLDENIDMRESVVTSGDAKLFLACKFVRGVAWFLIIISFLYFGAQAYTAMQSQSWHVNAAVLDQVRSRESGLQKSMADYSRTASILAPTGTLWQNMELILALFPESNEISLTDAKFSFDSKTKLNHWTFNGTATEEGMSYIRTMQNPTILNDAIRNVSSATGAKDGVFDPAQVRNVSVREDASASVGSAKDSSGRNIRFSVDITSAPVVPLKKQAISK